MENKLELHPLSVPNLDDVVYQLLRERILRYDFAPGERLDLSELESSLAISRTPLKNALTKLEAEGLVDIQARRGTFVMSVSSEKLDEAYKIRSAFELYVALCFFKYLTPEDYAFFREVRRAMSEMAQTGNWQSIIFEYLQLDQQFHERFVARGGTPRMLQMFQQMNVHMQVARIVRHFQSRDFEAIHFEHEQIFDALEDPTSQRLSATLLNHLEASRMRALKYSQEAP